MARRRRTLLNAPTGRTHTAPPARQREGTPAAGALSYGEPQALGDHMPDALEALSTEEVPTEVVPHPFHKKAQPTNDVPAPPAEFEQKPELAPDDLERNPPVLSENESLVPGVVMVAVAGALVLLVLLAMLALR